MEENKTYKFCIFASEENFKLICEYSRLLGKINGAIEQDCSQVLNDLCIEDTKEKRVIIKGVLKGMLPHIIKCENYNKTSQMSETLECCIKNNVLSVINNQEAVDSIKLEEKASSFATIDIYHTISQYSRVYNDIMANAYVDIATKVKSKIYDYHDAGDVIQEVAERVMKKLVVISEDYLTVDARASLLAKMGNFEIQTHWRGKPHVEFDDDTENDIDEPNNHKKRKVDKDKKDNPNNYEKRKNKKNEHTIVSIDSCGGQVADVKDYEVDSINKIACYEDVLFIFRHALDKTFVKDISCAVSCALMMVNLGFGSSPINGVYPLERYSGCTYTQLRSIIKKAIIDMACIDNDVVLEEDIDNVLVKYDERLLEEENGKPVGSLTYHKVDDNVKLTNDFLTFRRKCYRELLDMLAYEVRESVFDRSVKTSSKKR